MTKEVLVHFSEYKVKTIDYVLVLMNNTNFCKFW